VHGKVFDVMMKFSLIAALLFAACDGIRLSRRITESQTTKKDHKDHNTIASRFRLMFQNFDFRSLIAIDKEKLYTQPVDFTQTMIAEAFTGLNSCLGDRFCDSLKSICKALDQAQASRCMQMFQRVDLKGCEPHEANKEDNVEEPQTSSDPNSCYQDFFHNLPTVFLPLGVSEDPAFSKRVFLAHSPDAKCMDGSPAVYYISKGSHPTGFYIHHMGGSWCTTMQECEERCKKTPWYCGTGFTAETSNLTVNMLMIRDPIQNPLMHDWTFVFVVYCDGGSFLGDAQVGKYQFRGKAIREGLIESLKTTTNFAAATAVVIGGCSAGGLSSMLHADWYASQVPTAKVRAMPDSGYFLSGDYQRDEIPRFDTGMKRMFEMINAKSSLSSKCVEKHGYKCVQGPTYVEYVKTHIFLVTSQYDSSMSRGPYWTGNSSATFDCTSKYIGPPDGEATTNYFVHKTCKDASVNQFGHSFRLNLIQKLVSKGVVMTHHPGAGPKNKTMLQSEPHFRNGAFVDSCFRHCNNCQDRDPYLYNTKIDGHTAGQAFAFWYIDSSVSKKKQNFWLEDIRYPGGAAACQR